MTTIFSRGTGEALDPYLKSKLLLQRSAHGLPRTERYMRRTRSLIGLNDLIGLFSGMEEAKCVAKPLLLVVCSGSLQGELGVRGFQWFPDHSMSKTEMGFGSGCLAVARTRSAVPPRGATQSERGQVDTQDQTPSSTKADSRDLPFYLDRRGSARRSLHVD